MLPSTQAGRVSSRNSNANRVVPGHKYPAITLLARV
ncbi:hypothetical protein FG05_35308 [Fusarium graminearum]|nr:hypothetical protein FG05_35308 [Fusarium graminearum]